MTVPTESGPYQIAGGSVPGRSHAIAGRNNQDAFWWIQSEEGAVAVVCDGCGSQPHSEVGANIAVHVIAEAAAKRIGQGRPASEIVDGAHAATLDVIDALVRRMSARDYHQTVLDYFLFTVVGVLIDGGRVTPFSLGDGVVMVNDERMELGPFANNEPPYLSYGLLRRSSAPRFAVHPSLELDACRSFLIGTDGALHLPELELYRDNDRMFRHADMVRRSLAVQQRMHRALADDTTLIVGRLRRPRKEQT